MVYQFLPNLRFEFLALIQCQAITFCDDGNNVDDLAKLFHHNDVNWAQRMAGGVDEVQAAVDAGVLDVTITHGSQLLAKVRGVLVLDVFNDRIPAREFD